jgi:hypothetical protein
MTVQSTLDLNLITKECRNHRQATLADAQGNSMAIFSIMVGGFKINV